MRHLLLTLFFCCFSLLLRGAEQGIPPSLDISIDYSRDPFYQEIWFWALVALFFLLLLVLLIRGGRRTKKEDEKLSGVEEQPGNTGEQNQ